MKGAAMYIGDVRFNGHPEDISDVVRDGQSHRKINLDLCTAIDMTKVGIVLDKMVEAGMPKELAKIYDMQAATLLALLRTENNRLFGK